MSLFHPYVNCSLGGVRFHNPDGSGLRVVFHVTRTLTSSPDSAEVAIYNMDPLRRQRVQSTFTELGEARLTLDVGYDGVTKPLFAGSARKMKAHVREGADIATMVTADDGGEILQEVLLQASTKNYTPENMIDKCLAFLELRGIHLQKHPSVDATINSVQPGAATSAVTFVHVGTAAQLFDEAARQLGARWWVRDDQLFMAALGRPTDGIAVILPRSHWLSEPVEEDEDMIGVSTFLDPLLTPGRLVRLRGRTTEGVDENFRVEAGSYQGDSDSSSPFNCSLKLKRLVL